MSKSLVTKEISSLGFFNLIIKKKDKHTDASSPFLSILGTQLFLQFSVGKLKKGEMKTEFIAITGRPNCNKVYKQGKPSLRIITGINSKSSSVQRFFSLGIITGNLTYRNKISSLKSLNFLLWENARTKLRPKLLLSSQYSNINVAVIILVFGSL